MNSDAYELGKKLYAQHGYKLELSPYEHNTDEHNSFERGMIQAYKRNPKIHDHNESIDNADIEYAREAAKKVQRLDDERRKKKSEAYIRATKGE